MSSSNVVRTHPYAHVQHMKTVKHLIYIFDIDVGAMILNGSTASACTMCCGVSGQQCNLYRRSASAATKFAATMDWRDASRVTPLTVGVLSLNSAMFISLLSVRKKLFSLTDSIKSLSENEINFLKLEQKISISKIIQLW